MAPSDSDSRDPADRPGPSSDRADAHPKQDPTALQAALREHFGHADFRGPQRAICEHVLAGGSGLIIMATGDGKSLCYQLPAMVSPGLTLVISPLIALMDDQVKALEERGLPATCVHSMLDAKTRRARLQSALDGDVQLLYCTPERFRVPGFLEQVQASGREIDLLAVDEAHCLSHWGHDFRPDYQRLGEIRAALGDPPTLALTATATPAVQDDIRATLRIEDAPRWHTGIDRPGLFLEVTQVDHPDDKIEPLLERIEHAGGPGIVYTALIRDLRRLEDQLRVRGFEPLVYHGDLSASERRQQQARFLESRDALMLATNAFGMGVDKPDIRFIVHWQIPRTLEAYYQEIGRAGRDGKAAVCELLYCEQDLSIQREFTEWANPDQEFLQQVVQIVSGLGERAQAFDVQDLRQTLLLKNRRDGRVETCLRLLRVGGCIRGELGPGGGFEFVREPTEAERDAWLPADKRERDLRGLLEMVRYASHDDCRKDYVHRYFGFENAFGEDGCGQCDHEADALAFLDSGLSDADRNPVPRRAPRLGTAEDAPVERGDWIDVKGHGLCAVTRVHRTERGTRVDVERARDLQTKRFDLGRIKWRRVTE